MGLQFGKVEFQNVRSDFEKINSNTPNNLKIQTSFFKRPLAKQRRHEAISTFSPTNN